MNKIRTIKSFVKRSRQLGVSKQKIFSTLWPQYGLEPDKSLISPQKIFGHNDYLVLEIGFGNGENLFALAQKYPTRNFIGIEVHVPGIAALLTRLANQQLPNLKIYNEDAKIILNQCIPNKTLDEIFILFPDPWPKKRHHKRRLIQEDFIQLLHLKLKPQGKLNIATDWEDYALHIAEVLKNTALFTQKTQPTQRDIVTKFEKRGKLRGHNNFEFLFVAK